MVIYDHRAFEIENYDFYSLIFVKFYLSFLRIKNPCPVVVLFSPSKQICHFFYWRRGTKTAVTALHYTITLSSLRSLRLSGTFAQATTVDNAELELSKGIRIQV